MSLPRREELVADWLTALLRRARLAYVGYVRRRQERCLRCGRLASWSCQACGARVCDLCWLPSIETGAVASLCLDCIAPRATSRSPSHARPSPGEVFRAGARPLAWGAGAALAFSYFKYGWAGPGRLLALLLDPTITLALVPLAWLLGSVRIAVVRAVRAVLGPRSGPSS